MKKIIIALMSVMITVGLVGIGTYAIFSDTETSLGNTFTAGTLDLKVDGEDDGATVAHIELDNIAPGWSGVPYTWVLKNVGTIPGKVSVTISNIINNENGLEEPEYNPDTAVYAPGESAGDVGELGAELIYRIDCPSGWGPVNEHGQMFGAWVNSPNSLDGKTMYPNPGGHDGILDLQEQVTFKITLRLPDDVGNCVQGDSVEFDIIFHLDQS